MDVIDGREVTVADDDEAVAEAVSSLLADEARRVMLAEGARRWGEASLGWESGVAGYRRLCGELLAGRE